MAEASNPGWHLSRPAAYPGLMTWTYSAMNLSWPDGKRLMSNPSKTASKFVNCWLWNNLLQLNVDIFWWYWKTDAYFDISCTSVSVVLIGGERVFPIPLPLLLQCLYQQYWYRHCKSITCNVSLSPAIPILTNLITVIMLSLKWLVSGIMLSVYPKPTSVPIFSQSLHYWNSGFTSFNRQF